MDFKKKLKMRLYLAIAYMVIGILTIIVANITKTDNEFLYPFGTSLLFFGIARTRIYFKNTKDEKTIRSLEIRETDERNVEIINKAKSMTFNLSIIIAGIAVIVLQLIGMNKESLFFAYGVCFLTFLYWLCYMIIRKKY